MTRTSNSQPLVTIICITFNQAPYIREALDSFLMQRTDFDIEVLVHDDASTDGTTEIIKDYAKRFPKIIKPLYEKENQYSKGDLSFLRDMFNMAKGKYIAECEGDDFWTDPEKLQIQSDFMEQHPEYVLCFHPVRVFFEKGDEPDYIYPAEKDPALFDLEHLLKNNFIQTNSVMFRNKKDYQDLATNLMPLDWYTHLYNARLGEIGFIDKVMGAYRRHPGGIWWDASKDVEQLLRKHGVMYFNFLCETGKLYQNDPRYLHIILDNIGYILGEIMKFDAKYPKDETMNKIHEQMPRALDWFIARQTEYLGTVQYELRVKSKQKSQEPEDLKSANSRGLKNKIVKTIGKKTA